MEHAACACTQVAAWLSHIKTENIAYPACTLQYNGKQCSKKVQDSGGGQGDMQVIQPLPAAGILFCCCRGLKPSCTLVAVSPVVFRSASRLPRPELVSTPHTACALRLPGVVSKAVH